MKQLSILLLALLSLSGCLKDRLTHIIEGSYTVSGAMYYYNLGPFDSLGNTTFVYDTAYYNNMNVTVEKVSKTVINVNVHDSLFSSYELTFSEEQSGDNDYVFHSPLGENQFQSVTFNRKDWDVINLYIHNRYGNAGYREYYFQGNRN